MSQRLILITIAAILGIVIVVWTSRKRLGKAPFTPPKVHKIPSPHIPLVEPRPTRILPVNSERPKYLPKYKYE